MLNMSTALRTARAQAIITAIDTGSSDGTMNVYSGTKPATGDAVTTQTLLGTITFQKPCGTATNGVLSFNTTANTAVLADGTISWARIKNGNGVMVADVDCGVSGGGATIIFNNLAVIVGGNFSLLTAQIIEGNL